MRLLADENFPKPIIEALRAEGHDVLWARTGPSLPQRLSQNPLRFPGVLLPPPDVIARRRHLHPHRLHFPHQRRRVLQTRRDRQRPALQQYLQPELCADRGRSARLTC